MQFAPDGELGGVWRETCSERLREMGFYPLDITALDVAYTNTHGKLYSSFDAADKRILEMKSNLRKHFVTTDLQLIEENSDAIILLYDEGVRKGAGTISEAQHAYNLGLPIFIVNSFDKVKEIPGWLIALSTRVFPNFDELHEYLVKLPEGILRPDMFGNRGSGNEYLCSLCGDPFEKNKHHFVSKVSPLYCKSCVDIVSNTFEQHKDRYEYFIELITNDLSITIEFPEEN
jgi:hypothetical protein